MDELLNNLEWYRQFVRDHKNTELFIALNEYYYIECTEDFVELQHKEIRGAGLRIFNDNYTNFLCCDGISSQSIGKMLGKKTPITQLPPANIIPMQKHDIEPCNYQDLEKTSTSINAEECHMLWDNISSNLNAQSEKLLKLHIQYQREAYFLFSSTGIEGYSVRTIFAPGVELQSKQACFYFVSPKILPFTDTSIINNLCIFNENVSMITGSKKINYILFSGSAISKILYFLSTLLCKDMILAGNSIFDISDLGKRIFSKEITLEENSSVNEITIGNVDGEGMPRVQKKIIENGILRAFFSDYAPEHGMTSTGSAYRFSHIELPKVHPTKIAAIGTVTVDSILETYDNIIKIDDIIGIVESLNPKTSEFNAYTTATIYHGRTPTARLQVNIKTRIIDILNEIVSIADDGQYGADGSIYAGSFLIRNNNIISS